MKPLKPTWEISKKLILENFDFLQSEFGFSKFKNKWIKDEYYITALKDNIEFECLIFKFSSSYPEIGITNYSEKIEFRGELMPKNFYHINKLDKTGELKKIGDKGNQYVSEYIEKCALFLRGNSNILNGVMSDL